MKPPEFITLGLLLLLIGGTTAMGGASEAPEAMLNRFSEMAPGEAVTGWQPITFKKIDALTRYELVEDGGRIVLRADSVASASGLVKPLDIDPVAYPVLSWEWKVNRTIAKGDVTKKSGDDYAARIYITFAAPPEKLSFIQRTKLAAIRMVSGKTPPTAALAYVWGNRASVGSIHPNPYTSRVQMIVVDSGADHLNQWRSAHRNVVEDFKRAFGTDPPRISGVAVMTDSDNTGESATAWYGDISFSRKTDD